MSPTLAKRAAQRFVSGPDDQHVERLKPQIQHSSITRRAQQPAPQQPASHRGRACVEHSGERSLAISGEALDELEVALGDRVEHHRIALPFETNRTDVG